MHKHNVLTSALAFALCSTVAFTAIMTKPDPKAAVGVQLPAAILLTQANRDGDVIGQFVGYVADSPVVPEEVINAKGAKHFDSVEGLLTAAAKYLKDIDQNDIRFLIEDEQPIAVIRAMQALGISIPNTCATRFYNLSSQLAARTDNTVTLDEYALQQGTQPSELKNVVTRNKVLTKTFKPFVSQVNSSFGFQPLQQGTGTGGRHPTPARPS
jgi:hypothetical protein